MDANEAARALFFLQTSPVVAHHRPRDGMPPMMAPLPTKIEHDSDEEHEAEYRSLRHEVEDEDGLKPGPALLALLNLNKICKQRPTSLSVDGGSTAGALSPQHSPKSPRSAALALDVLTRDRASSVAAVEKRFSSDAMPIGHSGKIGHYSREERRRLIDRFLKKRHRRIWRKRVKYDVRKSFADSRLRVKGRFVRKEDEDQLRELLIMSF